jgi:phage gp36-like protein
MPENPTPVVYATRADLAKYGLPAAALADIDGAAQDAALAAASGEADSYLATVFTLPLVEWSPALSQQVCAMAAWHLLAATGFNPSGQSDQAVRQRCEDARRWLERIAAQKATLEATDSSADDDSEVGPIVLTRPLRGWRPE